MVPRRLGATFSPVSGHSGLAGSGADSAARLGSTLALWVTMTEQLSTHRFTRLAAAIAVTAALTTGAATQTRIVAPSNKYAPADDVKLGREAAAQAMKELPMLNDQRVDDWVEAIGTRLVQAIPSEFQHSE